MPQMNPAQTRVADPILSTIAHGYKNVDVSRVGRILFPRVPIPARGAKILEFGKDSFRLYNTRRAPGSSTKRIQYGHDAGAIALTQEALDAVVPIELMEEAQAVPGIDLARGSVEMVQEVFDRAEEYEQVKMATDASRYDANHKVALSGTDMWSDPSAKVGKQVKEYREAIRASTGRYPNVMAIAPDVFNALTENTEIRDRFKYTSSESVTLAMLAAYFSIPTVVIANDVYMDDADGDDADFTDVMAGQVVIAYVPSAARYEVPSYGYTYYLQGHPMVQVPYWDHGSKSWVYGMTYERQVVQTGKGAGFLIQNVV